MGASEEEPVMFLLHKMPQTTVYGYNYLFEFSKEMVKNTLQSW